MKIEITKIANGVMVGTQGCKNEELLAFSDIQELSKYLRGKFFSEVTVREALVAKKPSYRTWECNSCGHKTFLHINTCDCCHITKMQSSELPHD